MVLLQGDQVVQVARPCGVKRIGVGHQHRGRTDCARRAYQSAEITLEGVEAIEGDPLEPPAERIGPDSRRTLPLAKPPSGNGWRQLNQLNLTSQAREAARMERP